MALYSFGDIFLSMSPLFITKGATSVAELDSGTVGIAADDDDDIVDMALTSCCIMDSMRVIRSAMEVTMESLEGVGRWPIAF